MSAQVYTFKITYKGCDNKIWRLAEASSNNTLAKLGYLVLASFDTNAYHLFSIEYNATVYETAIEYDDDSPLMSDFKLSALQLKPGEHMEMIYDFGCEQVFDIEFIGEAGMQQGKGMSYPRIIDGAGRGIIDDMSADELTEIIRRTDKKGKSDFMITTKYGNEIIWDYRDYNICFDNALLRGEIQRIADGYKDDE